MAKGTRCTLTTAATNQFSTRHAAVTLLSPLSHARPAIRNRFTVDTFHRQQP